MRGNLVSFIAEPVKNDLRRLGMYDNVTRLAYDWALAHVGEQVTDISARPIPRGQGVSQATVQNTAPEKMAPAVDDSTTCKTVSKQPVIG